MPKEYGIRFNGGRVTLWVDGKPFASHAFHKSTPERHTLTQMVEKINGAVAELKALAEGGN